MITINIQKIVYDNINEISKKLSSISLTGTMSHIGKESFIPFNFMEPKSPHFDFQIVISKQYENHSIPISTITFTDCNYKTALRYIDLTCMIEECTRVISHIIYQYNQDLIYKITHNVIKPKQSLKDNIPLSTLNTIYKIKESIKSYKDELQTMQDDLRGITIIPHMYLTDTEVLYDIE